ncbi:DUF7504 family protein [Natronococcus occultus]|uniref:RecA-superfamily ATPase possibly involved in signal transduction n=1 Tax=Natronococcus occultus SP4 TaxID=694430 RepID=L0JSU3_9EURY|nr:hypothetical protein [Natronococcus occultus]AGB36087.1 hypothetical protein Natoc_0210 [Natronococcus occultus SP4]
MLSETPARGPDDAFIEELSRLKQRGASVLVVGSARASQQAETCRRLLGHATDRSRRRILVSTTAGRASIESIVSDYPTDSYRLIRHDIDVRSASVATGSHEPIPSTDGPVTMTDTLADLGIEISNAIESFESDADGLAPSELRIGVDSLLPLLENYGDERVFRFIHLTNGRVRTTNGMIHYRLPVDRESDVVSVLTPLFDVVVELRTHNGTRQERWSLKDESLCSGWISTTQL